MVDWLVSGGQVVFDWLTGWCPVGGWTSRSVGWMWMWMWMWVHSVLLGTMLAAEGERGVPVVLALPCLQAGGAAGVAFSDTLIRLIGGINKQWEVIELEQLTSHIERRPTTTETRVVYDSSSWHAINTGYIHSTKETSHSNRDPSRLR